MLLQRQKRSVLQTGFFKHLRVHAVSCDDPQFAAEHSAEICDSQTLWLPVSGESQSAKICTNMRSGVTVPLSFSQQVRPDNQQDDLTSILMWPSMIYEMARCSLILPTPWHRKGKSRHHHHGASLFEGPRPLWCIYLFRTYGVYSFPLFCGKLDQLQTQNEKIINLTPKETGGRLFPLFVKRLKSDSKVTSWAPKVTQKWLLGLKKSLLSHLTKRGKVSF